MADNEIRIGIVATLVGAYASMGEDGVRGAQLAIAEFDGQVAGKRILHYVEGSSAIPDVAVGKVEKLLDQDRCDFTVAPLSGNEGLAVREYAKERPDIAFINGAAAAQEMTLYDPADNFFSFFSNGVQWMAGLGTYCYEELGYRKVITLAEDYSFPHSQVGGFMIEFCRAGGRVLEKIWVPLGKSDFRDIIEAIPPGIDAIFAAVGGTDAVHFLQQYEEAGRQTPLIGGSITIDQTVLGTSGELAKRIVGIPSGSPIADNNPDPAWQSFVASYQEMFPDAPSTPSLLAFGYYCNMKGALLALQEIDADLSDGQAAFMKALADVRFDSPTGPISLDHNRQAVANVFITVVDQREDGSLYNMLLKTIPQVNQTLGIPEAEYLEIGHLTRDNPTCP